MRPFRMDVNDVLPIALDARGEVRAGLPRAGLRQDELPLDLRPDRGNLAVQPPKAVSPEGSSVAARPPPGRWGAVRPRRGAWAVAAGRPAPLPGGRPTAPPTPPVRGRRPGGPGCGCPPPPPP